MRLSLTCFFSCADRIKCNFHLRFQTWQQEGRGTRQNATISWSVGGACRKAGLSQQEHSRGSPCEPARHEGSSCVITELRFILLGAVSVSAAYWSWFRSVPVALYFSVTDWLPLFSVFFCLYIYMHATKKKGAWLMSSWHFWSVQCRMTKMLLLHFQVSYRTTRFLLPYDLPLEPGLPREVFWDCKTVMRGKWSPDTCPIHCGDEV